MLKKILVSFLCCLHLLTPAAFAVDFLPIQVVLPTPIPVTPLPILPANNNAARITLTYDNLNRVQTLRNNKI